MTFPETIKIILGSALQPLTPQDIRSIIKEKYPVFYGTPRHQLNVQKGHYKDLDHALLAQIYSLIRTNDTFSCDTNVKPMRISLNQNDKKEKLNPIKLNIKESTRNTDNLIANQKSLYMRSLNVLKDFGGPSVYFHIQAIKEQETAFLSKRHLEMIYAALASWGMHKMGDPDSTKAKLVNFSEFENSILIHKDQFKLLTSLRMDNCTQDEYSKYIDQLEKIYYNLNVSISKATIVANSKTLAHILPNLIPPIDRQYTIRFFTQEYKNFYTKTGKFKAVSLPENIQDQFSDFKKYCCGIKALYDRCDNKYFQIDKDSFNTSSPKIMDNLIMAFVKETSKTIRTET
jgi:hypothetical protein